MRSSASCVLLFLVVVGTSSMVINLSTRATGSSDGIATQFGQSWPVTAAATESRKLKESLHNPRKARAGDVNLEDYRAIDPVPSSKASIKHGPIEHGSPIIPYIPKPSPPPTTRRP